jgi:hypothetical protein
MADYGSEVEFGASMEPLLIAVCDDIDPWKLWADERLCTASE